MAIFAKRSGTHKETSNVQAKVNGEWKQGVEMLVKRNGKWERCWLGKTFIMGNNTAYIDVYGASSVKLVNVVYKMYSPTGELIYTSETSDMTITYSAKVITVKEGSISITLTSDRGMRVVFNMNTGYTSYKWSFEFDDLVIL